MLGTLILKLVCGFANTSKSAQCLFVGNISNSGSCLLVDCWRTWLVSDTTFLPAV